MDGLLFLLFLAAIGAALYWFFNNWDPVQDVPVCRISISGDLLATLKGTVGERRVVPENSDIYAPGQQRVISMVEEPYPAMEVMVQVKKSERDAVSGIRQEVYAHVRNTLESKGFLHLGVVEISKTSIGAITTV